jgi:hypothetical protein
MGELSAQELAVLEYMAGDFVRRMRAAEEPYSDDEIGFVEELQQKLAAAKERVS